MFGSTLSSRARRSGVLGLIACVCAGVALLSATALAGSLHPRLALLQRSPVKVQGRGFWAQRLVTITVTANGRSTRTVRTNRYGGFTVIVSTNIPACTAWSISAAQARTQGTMLRGPRVDCAPMSTN